MKKEKLEDVRDTAVKLETLYSQSPTDYAYLKDGFIAFYKKKRKHVALTSRPKTVLHNIYFLWFWNMKKQFKIHR